MFSLKALRLVPRGYGAIKFSIIQRANSQVQQVLLQMDETLKTNKKLQLVEYLQKLERVDVQWSKKTDGQTLLSSVLHGLLVTKQHDDLLLLINYLKSADYNMWSGMASVVLKSYSALKMWDEAVNQFESLKKRDQIKNIRIIGEFVSALAADNEIAKALKYFQEMQDIEINLKSSKLKKTNSKKLLKELLEAVNRVSILTADTTSLPQSELSSMHVSPVCTRRRFNVDSTSDDVETTLKQRHVLTGLCNELVKEVIEYMHYWNVKPSNEITNLLIKWFSKKQSSVTHSFLDGTKCHSCNTDLDKSYREVCNDLVRSIEKKCANMHADVQHLKQVLKQNQGYFHVIIDAGNILFHEKQNKLKQLNTEILFNVLQNLHEYSPKPYIHVAVVFPQSFSRADKLKQFSFLNEIARENMFSLKMTTISLRKINDDLVLCYLMAQSELNLLANPVGASRAKGVPKTPLGRLAPTENEGCQPLLVTDDNFNDHRLLVRKENQGDFLDWIQHRKQSFHRLPASSSTTKTIRVNYVSSDEDKIHLLSDHERLICIKKH